MKLYKCAWVYIVANTRRDARSLIEEGMSKFFNLRVKRAEYVVVLCPPAAMLTLIRYGSKSGVEPRVSKRMKPFHGALFGLKNARAAEGTRGFYLECSAQSWARLCPRGPIHNLRDLSWRHTRTV